MRQAVHALHADEPILMQRQSGLARISERTVREPGVKTIWLGMQRILDFAAGVRLSRELQPADRRA